MAERPPLAVFAEHAARGELAYQVDAGGRPVWRPRYGPYEWRVSAGRGAVYATTVVHRRDEPPANVALIDLDEGFRMMSRVEGVEPDEVLIGMRVRVRFDQSVPVFVPEEHGA
jgi:hypothetical protein